MTTSHVLFPPAVPRIVLRSLVALGAVGAALVVWAIAVPVLGAQVTVPDAPGSTERSELTLPSLLGAAVVATLAGCALLAVLERLISPAREVWTVVAVLVLVATLPYLPGFTLVERATLGGIHLALAGVLIPGLRATSPAARRGRPQSRRRLGEHRIVP